jgi:hypothetical protein
MRAQMIPATFYDLSTEEDIYGWYIIPITYTHRLFVDTGEVFGYPTTFTKIMDYINTTWVSDKKFLTQGSTNATSYYTKKEVKENFITGDDAWTSFISYDYDPDTETPISGASGWRIGHIVTVNFNGDNLDFPKGTTSSYRGKQLSARFRPNHTLDIKTTTSGNMRFRINTSGYIYPASTVTADNASLRGTFTWMV